MEDLFEQLETTLALATEDAQYWDPSLDIVVEILGARGALFPATDPFFRGMWMAGTRNMKDALTSYLSDGWFKNDPREAVLKRMMEKGHACDHDVFPDRARKDQIPIYRDYLYPLNFGVSYCVRIITPNGYWALAIHFDNDHPEISPADAILIKRIQAMFAKATTRADELAHKRIATFAQFFKGTESEVFVLDVDGKACFSINSDGKLQSQTRMNHLLPEEVSEDIVAEIRELCVSDPNLSLSRAFQFNTDRNNTNVLVIQIPPSLRHFFMHFKVCAIRTECSVATGLKHTQLRENYGLTASEIATVDLLVDGNTPNMISDILSLKVSTVRQRLKQIFEKVQVNSQVELIGFHNRL
ncbi:LuxR C-terminal-related transcriptional regulator [Thalassobius sp. I31.1]|uniref:helix-turn-helix transcriptional regulator n=1 Tax=Thalassobius sp. I31.1 TaxID=2109912 RepID=UPI00130096A6|nr:LuxR C-terminal-related transcriptional regulator [Thalassobius sp. I31.1]